MEVVGMSITAMRQALEALYMANAREWPENKIGAAINALSAAIAEAEKQEPVKRTVMYRPADLESLDLTHEDVVKLIKEQS
jgi:hypothetical protein